MNPESKKLFDHLRQVIDIPESVVSVTLRVSVHSDPTIETERILHGIGDESLFERFKLVPDPYPGPDSVDG